MIALTFRDLRGKVYLARRLIRRSIDWSIDWQLFLCQINQSSDHVCVKRHPFSPIRCSCTSWCISAKSTCFLFQITFSCSLISVHQTPSNDSQSKCASYQSHWTRRQQTTRKRTLTRKTKPHRPPRMERRRRRTTMMTLTGRPSRRTTRKTTRTPRPSQTQISTITRQPPDSTTTKWISRTPEQEATPTMTRTYFESATPQKMKNTENVTEKKKGIFSPSLSRDFSFSSFFPGPASFSETSLLFRDQPSFPRPIFFLQ